MAGGRSKAWAAGPSSSGANASASSSRSPSGSRRGSRRGAPARARALVAEAVSAWQLDHLELAAQLIASELVSNAVEHAGTAVDFRLVRTWYGLCIAVRDGDPHPPYDLGRVSVGRPTPRGRGLAIVGRIASRWGCLIGTADKVVWAMLRDTLARPARPGSIYKAPGDA